jgi:hypothetical protein
MIAAVGSVFAVLGVASELAETQFLGTLHTTVSQSFLLGILALLASAGGAGWLRSRHLGYVSVVIAVLGLVALGFVVTPFLAIA